MLLRTKNKGKERSTRTLQSVCASGNSTRVHAGRGKRERKSRGQEEGEKEISEKQDEEINLYEVLINVNPT